MNARERVFSGKEISAILNEWMRRYIKEPERFAREFEYVQRYIYEKGEGQEPSYGETCVEYMIQIYEEMNIVAGIHLKT